LKEIQEEELKQKKQFQPPPTPVVVVQKEDPSVSRASWTVTTKSKKPSLKEIQEQELHGRVEYPQETSKPNNFLSSEVIQDQKPTKIEKPIQQKTQNPPKAKKHQVPVTQAPIVWGSPASSPIPKSLKEIQAEEQGRGIPKSVPQETMSVQPQKKAIPNDREDLWGFGEAEKITKPSQPPMDSRADFPSLAPTKKTKPAATKSSNIPTKSTNIPQANKTIPQAAKQNPVSIPPPAVEANPNPTSNNKKSKKKGAKFDPNLLGFSLPRREGEIEDVPT